MVHDHCARRLRHLLSAAALAAVLQGCSRDPDLVLTLTTADSDPSVVAETERVLLARFEEFPETFFSSVHSEVEGSRITFVFMNGAPDAGVIEYLYTNPGKLQATLATGIRRKLFDEEDILDVQLAYVDSQYVFRLRLTPDAGARVFKLTSEHVGEVARTTLDGKVLVEATIAAAFGERLQVGVPDIPRRAELVAIMRSGALPTSVSVVSSTSAAASVD